MEEAVWPVYCGNGTKMDFLTAAAPSRSELLKCVMVNNLENVCIISDIFCIMCKALIILIFSAGESTIAIPQLEGSTSATAILQPQLRNCNFEIAIFSDVCNFKSATWELHFCNLRHIFGRGIRSGFMKKKSRGKKTRATVPFRQV